MLQFFKACGRAEAMAAARRVQVAGVGKTRTEELRKKRDKEQRRTITTEVRLLGEGDGGERGEEAVIAVIFLHKYKMGKLADFSSVLLRGFNTKFIVH
jgi:hypothetical protein